MHGASSVGEGDEQVLVYLVFKNSGGKFFFKFTTVRENRWVGE
jgi:hypothetical protein